ncbi:hypothetical protein L9F63_020369 [Diploptera punctata]|uniref:Ankyrin repeat domain-containing protein n=1 Tax=Diploptera punctata TaxID=6984 RepID=A0AAD8EDH3_DIPPU|nr:hypothetical protein L9F63_020369 [Diploptera punctata]
METMLLALDEGADIETKDNEEWTPLMRGVVLESSFPILQKLLERGALVNAVDRRGQTCLMQAVLSGREDVVKLLVESEADLTPSNVYNNTALDMARAREFKDMLPHLSPKPVSLKEMKKWKKIIKEKM